jgi:hypothetical protein
MTRTTDVLVFGTGNFAARMVFDIAATARTAVHVTIAGRNRERLDWLRVAASSRAAVFRTAARFAACPVDLAQAEGAEATISACRPKVVVQAASTQTPSVIATTANAWGRLVAEGGLSATAVLQSLFSMRVAAAVPAGCQMINCCFPDVVNALIAARGLPIGCGTGNIAILSNAFAASLDRTVPGDVRMLAHYQCLAPFRKPAGERGKPMPRVWIDEAEIVDVQARFASVKLTAEPAIEISGASGVPLILAMAAGEPWRGHVPGPYGLPGGYPVIFDGQALRLDLPSGLTRNDAVAWNARFEQENGLVVGRDGFARYTGRLAESLHAVSPKLAAGFAVADLEAVYAEMEELRAKLLSRSASN